MLHKLAIKVAQRQTRENQFNWAVFMEFILFIMMFFFLSFHSFYCPIWRQLCAIDQTIQSMSRMMKSPNKNQKQITKPHQYYRCRILCLPHRCTITHKKPCTRPAHDCCSWPLNGPRICRVSLSSLFVIRWASTFSCICFFSLGN